MHDIHFWLNTQALCYVCYRGCLCVLVQHAWIILLLRNLTVGHFGAWSIWKNNMKHTCIKIQVLRSDSVSLVKLVHKCRADWSENGLLSVTIACLYIIIYVNGDSGCRAIQAYADRYELKWHVEHACGEQKKMAVNVESYHDVFCRGSVVMKVIWLYTRNKRILNLPTNY